MLMISCEYADVFTCLVCVRQRWEMVEGTGRRAEGGRVQIGSGKTVMQSKYLDQRQEVIMRKFCCSLPVLTCMTLRAFGAGSVTGHTVLFSPKRPVHDSHTVWRAGRGERGEEGGLSDDVRDVCWWLVRNVRCLTPTPLLGPYCHYSSVLGPTCSYFFCCCERKQSMRRLLGLGTKPILSGTDWNVFVALTLQDCQVLEAATEYLVKLLVLSPYSSDSSWFESKCCQFDTTLFRQSPFTMLYDYVRFNILELWHLLLN